MAVVFFVLQMLTFDVKYILKTTTKSIEQNRLNLQKKIDRMVKAVMDHFINSWERF